MGFSTTHIQIVLQTTEHIQLRAGRTTLYNACLVSAKLAGCSGVHIWTGNARDFQAKGPDQISSQ